MFLFLLHYLNMSSGKKEESVKEEEKFVSNDEKQDVTTNEERSRDVENERETSPDLSSDTDSNDSDLEDEISPKALEDLMSPDSRGSTDQKSDTTSNDTGSCDSNSEKRSTPKTLEDLGIKLNQSNRKWRSYKDLIARQLGFISPVLFTRNVTGSVNMVERLKLERKLDGHSGCVNTLNFNSSGDLLASGSDDLDVVVWNWGKGKKIMSYESGHSGNVFQVGCLMDELILYIQ